MLRMLLFLLLIQAVALPASADLLGRLPATPGGTDYQAYYDDQLDVTWAANANLNGLATTTAQLAWVATFEIDGIGGWRLPTASSIDCSDPGTPQATCQASSEYGHLYAYGAGTTQGAGITASSPGPFSNVLGGINFYWSSVQPGVNTYYDFSFNSGATGVDFVDCCALGAWPVRDGDVGPPTPVPISGWVPGLVAGLSALIGAAALRRSSGSAR